MDQTIQALSDPHLLCRIAIVGKCWGCCDDQVCTLSKKNPSQFCVYVMVAVVSVVTVVAMVWWLRFRGRNLVAVVGGCVVAVVAVVAADKQVLYTSALFRTSEVRVGGGCRHARSSPSVFQCMLTCVISLCNVRRTHYACGWKGWRSDGVNKCDPFDYSDGKSCACSQKIKETCEPGKGTPHCAKISVNCLEGTGDFRLALMETKALKRDSSSGSNSNNSSSSGGGSKSPVADNFCPTTDGDGLHACIDQIGADYHAYQFRFMPHVGRTYVHPKDSEAGGFFSKQNSTDPFDYHRYTKACTRRILCCTAHGCIV